MSSLVNRTLDCFRLHESEDHHRADYTSDPPAAGGHRWILGPEEEVCAPVVLLMIIYLNTRDVFLIFCFFRQAEGPTGPLIASSNPEYISANDGKRDFQITKKYISLIRAKFPLHQSWCCNVLVLAGSSVRSRRLGGGAG